MRVFSWLTGNKDHHIQITEGKAGKFWWRIVRVEENPDYSDDPPPFDHDVANQPTPGFDTFEHAEEAARAFLDGIGADYLKVER